jgi:hypothetical protein
MKRISIITLIIVTILVFIAWGRNSSKSSSSTTSSTIKTTTMEPALELAAGTLRLEGTSQAVDKNLAAQLLPYWQLLDELNASESTAPQEITSAVDTIQGIMTAEQVKAIQDMQLTQNDPAAVVQNGTSATDASTTKITNVSQVTSGGGPAGGPPNGGGPLDGGGPGGGFTSSSSQGNSSTSATSLIEEVIKLLEKRMNS